MTLCVEVLRLELYTPAFKVSLLYLLIFFGLLGFFAAFIFCHNKNLSLVASS
jgi:hypothetical protein